MLGVPTLPVFEYYSRVISGLDSRSSMLVREVAVSEFAIMALVCFLRAQSGVEPLFSTVRMRSLDDGYLVTVPLPPALRTLLFKRGLLCMLSVSGIHLMNGLLEFPCTAEIAWTTQVAIRWFYTILRVKKLSRSRRGSQWAQNAIVGELTSQPCVTQRNPSASSLSVVMTVWVARLQRRSLTNFKKSGVKLTPLISLN